MITISALSLSLGACITIPEETHGPVVGLYSIDDSQNYFSPCGFDETFAVVATKTQTKELREGAMFYGSHPDRKVLVTLIGTTDRGNAPGGLFSDYDGVFHVNTIKKIHSKSRC